MSLKEGEGEGSRSLSMVRRSFLVLASLVPLATTAQSSFPRHHLQAGLGAAAPGADLAGNFSPSFGFGAHYGYRFLRNFQLDVGAEGVLGSARVRDFLDTTFGPRRIRDFQFFLPVGGRVVLPLADDRLEVFAGGGGVYVRYFEAVSQPNQFFRIDCPFCGARNGFGYYGSAGFRIRPGAGRGFWIGGSFRLTRVETTGDAFGRLGPARSRDRWITPMLDFGISF